MRRWPVVAVAVLLALATLAAREGEWALSFAPHGSALAHEELPFYSHADLRPRWDSWSRRRTVGRLDAIDADSQPLDARAFADGPTVVSFFWTGCGSLCPTNIDLLRGLDRSAKVLLVSDQPLIDRPAQLAAWAMARGLPSPWRLATGQPERIYRWARDGLFIDIDRTAANGDAFHDEVNFLIDRGGRLRGVYDADSPLDASRLQDDVRRLGAEPQA